MNAMKQNILISIFLALLGLIERSADGCLVAYADPHTEHNEFGFIAQILYQFSSVTIKSSEAVNLGKTWLKTAQKNLKAQGRLNDINLRTVTLIKNDVERMRQHAESKNPLSFIIGFVVQQMAAYYSGILFNGCLKNHEEYRLPRDCAHAGVFLATFASDPTVKEISAEMFREVIKIAETGKKPEADQENSLTSTGKEIAESSTEPPPEEKKLSTRAEKVIGENSAFVESLEKLVSTYNNDSGDEAFNSDEDIKKLFGEKKEHYKEVCAFLGEMLYGDVTPREIGEESAWNAATDTVSSIGGTPRENVASVLHNFMFPNIYAPGFLEKQYLHLIREHLEDNTVRLRFVKKVGNNYFFANGTQAKVAEDDILSIEEEEE